MNRTATRTPVNSSAAAFALLSLSLAALALPPSAQADDTPATGAAVAGTGWYGAIGYGRNVGHGPDDSSLNLLAGWKFQPNLGLELELNDGLRDGHRRPDPSAADPLHHDRGQMEFSAAAYGVAFLPLTPQLQLLARLGVGETQFSGNLAHPNGLNLTSLNAGLGAIYNVSATNAIRADYTHKSFDHHGDDDALAVSFVHKF